MNKVTRSKTMTELQDQLHNIELTGDYEKRLVVDQLYKTIESHGYEVVERNDEKPWGAYLRLNGEHADAFVEEFFPGLTPEQARLGLEKAELSPKLLLVSPSERLSWQYHNRRAERWAFLTEGFYNKSMSDEPGDIIRALPGEVVQFAKGERHRLIGQEGDYTVVAEIWQHVDSDELSNEDDIIRLTDDYGR